VALVDFLVGGALVGTDTDGTDGWSALWNSTLAPDGQYKLVAQGTDVVGRVSQHSITVTVRNVPVSLMHLGAMTATTKTSRNAWSASVAVVVHDAQHKPLSGVTVQASWDGGAVVATTDSKGVAMFSRSNISKTLPSVTFNVSNLSRSGFTYSAADNDCSETLVINRP
jgi:hypothetical protein